MSSFRVSIVKGQVLILCDDDLPETDIIDLLQFDETQIESLYRDHAAIQARWEQIAINLRNSYESFDEEFVKKWWAHNKKYAKLVIEGYGEKKPTIDAVTDQVILMYSEDTSAISQQKYVEIAYQAACKRDKEDKQEFQNSMLKYVLMNPQWTYETLIRTSKVMERNMQTVQNIAKRLDNRSYHMKDLKDLIMAKHFNHGPVTETEFKRMSSYIKGE
jgi:hypothetical protein